VLCDVPDGATAVGIPARIITAAPENDMQVILKGRTA
jgi:serine acetyltransferase